jgi:glutathione synthase/RimK-type ligase-like ATP-grasp enzyme
VPAVRWSLDKHYLADLSAVSVPVTPTVFVEPGTEPSFPETDFVVKPVSGAGSRDVSTYPAGPGTLARAHVQRLHGRGVTAMVQPLLKSVAVDGEWPMVFFDGEFSHTASKRVKVPQGDTIEGLFAEETNEPALASAPQIEVANAAMAFVTGRFGPLTYARVDLVNDDDGQPCVLEVELVEPSLFLPQASPAALERLVRAFTDH